MIPTEGKSKRIPTPKTLGQALQQLHDAQCELEILYTHKFRKDADWVYDEIKTTKARVSRLKGVVKKFEEAE